MFIKLTERCGRETYINFNSVVEFFQQEDFTAIFSGNNAGGGYYRSEVKETPEEILKKIKEQEK